MIVPAKPRYLGAERFAKGNVKTGETFSVDSGLGGSWMVKYIHHDGVALVFRRAARPDWPAADFRYADDADAARHVYILVPDDH
ncbi:hypothetical protein LCGC14_2068480 [marine sediment metagenome]|uniref:Uncharacterized protein n=1 Tax=marine sediment metagenome TaxID=412755 RepID=A0A0F9EJ04_9ZZZZ